MRSRWLLLFVLGGLIAASPDGPEADTQEANGRLLEKWRADPEHYQRLLSDLKAFQDLPLNRQERIRKFDRELHALDEKTRARLWAVLDRYHTWLERLPDQERQKITRAAPAERLSLIREIRQQQWVDRLPAKLREEVLKLPEDRRAKFVAELRRQERAQRVVWMKPAAEPPEIEKPKPGPKPKPGGPAHLAEFPTEVQRFFRDQLQPRLTKIEKGKLLVAEGKWPEFPRLIRALADRHPVLPPSPSLGKITSYKQLPAEISIRFAEGQFAHARPRWPEYALAVARIAKRKMEKAPSLGASKPDEFPREVQSFLRSRLLPKLSSEQKKGLQKLEGHWPEYPERLLDLARQKRMVIPGMSLPGPSELWEGKPAL